MPFDIIGILILQSLFKFFEPIFQILHLRSYQVLWVVIGILKRGNLHLIASTFWAHEYLRIYRVPSRKELFFDMD